MSDQPPVGSTLERSRVDNAPGLHVLTCADACVWCRQASGSDQSQRSAFLKTRLQENGFLGTLASKTISVSRGTDDRSSHLHAEKEWQLEQLRVVEG